jgi:hypothetical protein
MKLKIKSLIIYCMAVYSSILYAQNIYTGVRINESQLNSFIKSLRLIQPGIDTADDLEFAGLPHSKSNDAQIEKWEYSFSVLPDDILAETENLDRQISDLESKEMQLMERLFEVQKEAFKQKSKDLFAEVNRISDSKRQISDRKQPLIEKNIQLGYSRMTKKFEVNCNISLDSNRRIIRIEVIKGPENDRLLVYSKDATENSIANEINLPTSETKSEQNPQAFNSHPPQPTLGQIYFNTKDKCFYGWSGTKWDRLSGGQ